MRAMAMHCVDHRALLGGDLTACHCNARLCGWPRREIIIEDACRGEDAERATGELKHRRRQRIFVRGCTADRAKSGISQGCNGLADGCDAKVITVVVRDRSTVESRSYECLNEVSVHVET